MTTKPQSARRGALTLVIQGMRPLLEGVLDRRAGRMADLVMSEISDGQRILDVGCGDLRIGRKVTKRRNVQWTGIDTVDYREPAIADTSDPRINYRVYNGDVLPFDAATFDAVVLAFVLHHCVHPGAVMDEAVRVTRSRLLIFEAVPRNPVEFWIAKPYDWFVNRLRSPDIAMPFTFMSHKQLLREFDARGLRLVRAVPVRTHPLALVQQVMYVVERPRDRA